MAVNSGLGTLKAVLTQPDYPFLVVGVDPGGTTGISTFMVEEGSATQIDFAQWDNDGQIWRKLVNYAADLEEKTSYPVVLVVEQFDKRPGIIDPDYSAMYITQDIEANITEYPVIWQIPAAAKNLIKPAGKGRADQLKRFGLYHPNNRHANDATRHVLVYLVEKIKHRPTILKGWPKR